MSSAVYSILGKGLFQEGTGVGRGVLGITEAQEARKLVPHRKEVTLLSQIEITPDDMRTDNSS